MTNLNAVFTTNQIAVQSNLPPPAGFVVSRAEGSSHPVLEADATRTVRHAQTPLSLPGSILGNCLAVQFLILYHDFRCLEPFVLQVMKAVVED